ASSPTYFIVTCPTPSSTLFPYTTLFRSRHTLAHAIQQGFQAFVGVELRVGNQPGRVVENGVEHGLLFAPARPWDVGTKHHVRLPDLIGKLGLELLVRRRRQQLLLSQPVLFEKTVETGRR